MWLTYSCLPYQGFFKNILGRKANWFHTPHFEHDRRILITWCYIITYQRSILRLQKYTNLITRNFHHVIPFFTGQWPPVNKLDQKGLRSWTVTAGLSSGADQWGRGISTKAIRVFPLFLIEHSPGQWVEWWWWLSSIIGHCGGEIQGT